MQYVWQAAGSDGVSVAAAVGRLGSPRLPNCVQCKPSNVDQPTVTELMGAIAAAFARTEVRFFLTSLEARNARIRDIDDSSSELSRYLGAKQRDVTFHTMIQTLDDVSRYKVFDFYTEAIYCSDRNLKKEFKHVFRQ